MNPKDLVWRGQANGQVLPILSLDIGCEAWWCSCPSNCLFGDAGRGSETAPGGYGL